MGPQTQPAAQAPSAGEIWERLKGYEYPISYFRKRKLERAEDFVDLGNRYCPFCGRQFQLGDNVIELVTVYESELGNIVISTHYNCLLKALEGERE
jgi:hypothetical protein